MNYFRRPIQLLQRSFFSDFRVNRRVPIMKIKTLSKFSVSGLTFLALLLFAATMTFAQTPGPPSWTFTGSLKTKRYGHTATLLPNGKVMVVGGGGRNLVHLCPGSNTFYCLWFSTASNAELYDPASRT